MQACGHNKKILCNGHNAKLQPVICDMSAICEFHLVFVKHLICFVVHYFSFVYSSDLLCSTCILKNSLVTNIDPWHCAAVSKNNFHSC